ncbi:MAG: leucine-rich repeat protein [Lachnospiraceae bacterium]|nr:leucine-rich repeat protein [Lachnospiraceae bacterium]
MKKSKLAQMGKRLLSSTLITAMLLGGITATDIYYNYSPNTAYAATLSGADKTVAKPVWNAANIPARDTTGNVSYWYAGNEFKALNQMNDGVQQSGSGTSGHLKVYSDTGGARLVETSSNGKIAVKGNYSGGSDFDVYTQRSDLDFAKTWQLMDTDGVWDDQYLFAQYMTRSFDVQTTAFAPTILTDVENWYDNGFSYDGSKNSRPTISASGASWFSDAEKNAVKSATVKTDGVNGSSNTTTNDTVTDAHLFPASIDEMYYNPVQVEELIANLAADQSTTYNATSWQYARSYLWSRSFWGVYSNSNRNGFGVYSSGQVDCDYVAYEFGVAPAFYLDLEQIVMARSASNAAASAAASTGLKAYDTSTLDTTDGVKFLVQDDSFASGFTSSINNKNGMATVGNTYSVDYSGASTSKVNDAGTGSALCISAALYDSTGKIVYYGPLSKVSETSGTVSLTVPEDISVGNYTLALFEEQLGGTSTYDTTKNSNNGTSFSGTNHTYKAFETDYQSGSVALMSLNVVDDYHTGVTLTNGNSKDMSIGESIESSAVTGKYTSYNNTLNGSIAADDIFVIEASDWESNQKVSNSNLVHTLKIPETIVGNYEYYVVVKDLSVLNEYFASDKYTINCSENATGFDKETWYTYKDASTGITWNYKLDGNGDIIGLYTKNSIVKLVDGGGTLNIPAKVAGRTVVKIGGGDESTPVVPASETAYTSVSFPSTVTTINDYAFYGSKAEAQITIPSHVTAIGIKAFYDSYVTGVKISEMNGTVGSYAFGKTTKMKVVSVKGGNTGLTLSTVSFANSAVTDVSIYGNVTVNKQAFANDINLVNINMNGNMNLKEYAFTGCSAVTSLTMSGTTSIGAYAFNGLTVLEQVYIPVGTTLHEYSFNGCIGLKKLEVDVSIPANAFADCGAIEVLIFDDNALSLSYDWEGHTSSVTKRTIYIKNDTMQIELYGKDGTYHSPFGASGNITVYIPNTSVVDLGDTQKTNDKGVLTLNGYTCYAHSGNDVYGLYIKGAASSVTLRAVNNLDTQMGTDGNESVKDTEAEKKQTGIDAYYTGTILTTMDISKDKMTVVKMFGSDEGETYTTAEFYVVRTTEFNAEEKKTEGVQEDAIASYEPVHADADDLDTGSTTGTISVTAIVFYDVVDENGNVTGRKYYSTPVSIRVEEYTSKNYIEQVYGSYDAIAERLVALDKQIADLQAQLDSADVGSVEELTKELNDFKIAYAKIVATLEEFLSKNESDASGYFGTSTDENTGEISDVVFIEGNPTGYEDSGKKDADGNTIYNVSYDADGDGQKEDIHIVVKDDGVHVVDADGNPVKDDNGKEIIFKDTLGALERQAAAQLASIKADLKVYEDGLKAIKDALSDAGYDIVEGDNEYSQIVDAVNDMASKVDSLTGDLSAANNQIENYASALDAIYNKLTGSTLQADEITGLANALNAIVGKIQSLQNDLTVAQATVTDLRTQLSNEQSKVSQLQTELDSTKGELQKAESSLDAAKQEKDDLQAQYEEAIKNGDEAAAAALKEQIDAKNAAIQELETTKKNLEQKEQDLKDAQDTVKALQDQIDAKDAEITDLKKRLDALTSSAEGFKMTVDTANTLFGLELAEGTSDEDVLAAIQDYVSTKVSSDETIKKIQALVNSTNTGDKLVADVESSIGSGSGDGDYKSGYDTGYAEGVASVDVSTNGETYKNAYAAGVASVDVSVNGATYKSGYSAGYEAGAKSAGTNTGSGDYTTGYNAGYSAGVASVDTSKNYSSGYNTGYAAGYKAGESKNSGTENSSALTGQITSLTNEVNKLTSSNTSLTNQVTTLTSENSTLKNQVSNLTSQVDTLKNSKTTSSTTSTTTGNATASTNKTTGTASTTTPTAASTGGASSTNKTDTTSEDDKPQAVDESIDYEGSTQNNAINTQPSGLGYYVERKLPSDTSTIANGQLAVVKINQLSGDKAVTIKTNAKSYVAASSTEQGNAFKVISYYMNHLNELGTLGDSEIKSAATDNSKIVTADEVMSFDFEASEEQQKAIENGETVDLKITADKIENGALYLIVHESKVRTGTYDVLLARANQNELLINVPDLSPVTIAKITVDSAEEITTTELVNDDTEPEVLQESTDSNNGFRIVMYILLIVAIGGLVVLFVIMKKKDALPDFLKRK